MNCTDGVKFIDVYIRKLAICLSIVVACGDARMLCEVISSFSGDFTAGNKLYFTGALFFVYRLVQKIRVPAKIPMKVM